MDLQRLSQSFKDALKGLHYTLKHEQNFRIKLTIGALVIFAMYFFGITHTEKIVILLLVFSILSLELLNTAIEFFVDLIKPRFHRKVQLIKDIMAAVVLTASIGAAIVGVLIFYPYIIEWIL